MKIKLLILTIFAALLAASCNSAATGANKTGEPPPLAFGTLATEFKQSKEATRDKYKGKNLTVKGYAGIAPIMPTGADDAGILTLGEKGGDMMYMLTCQFTAAEKTEFSRVKGDQMVTVTGVFDDDLAMKLKSCRILNVE